jgi:hypothetical protein
MVIFNVYAVYGKSTLKLQRRVITKFLTVQIKGSNKVFNSLIRATRAKKAPYVGLGSKIKGISTNDPFDAIIPAIDYIQGKGWPVDFMALHQTIYSKFIRNTHVRELVHAGIASLGPNGGAFTLPGYPTVKVVTDFALTETPDGTHGPLIGSSVAPGLVFGEGPTMAAQYRDEAKGFDGYIIRKWQEPKVVIQDAITKICT